MDEWRVKTRMILSAVWSGPTLLANIIVEAHMLATTIYPDTDAQADLGLR